MTLRSRLLIATLGAGLVLFAVYGVERSLAPANQRTRVSAEHQSPINRGQQAAHPAPASTTRPPSSAGTVRQWLTATQVVGAWAKSYAAFADGAPARFPDGSVTADAQAVQGGRLEDRFRDGGLRVRVARLSSTLFSAQAIVNLQNRQETFPMTIDALREPQGWVVEQIIVPDFAAEARVQPAAVADTPPGARAITRSFAAAYLELRAGRVSKLPGAAAAITQAIATHTDPLAQTVVASRSVVSAVAFGPENDGEIAATVTVDVTAHVTGSFSILLRDTTRGWVCAEFL